MYLGVDGGGTKTAFALIDQTGKVLAEHSEKTCYHITVGLDGAQDVLINGTQATLAKAGISVEQLDYAFFGLPAYGEDTSLTQAIDKIPSAFLPLGSYHCDNDMISGWAAAFDCQDGINIVSGTGSIAYGVNQGKTARCGGWGELFSDEGSAYWIGRKGLMAFSKMSDGRLPKGVLYQMMKEAFSVEYDLDLSGIVHSKWHGERSKIAQVSTIVSAAADAGDSVSKEIFKEAGQELALIVEGTSKELAYANNETVRVSYSGGAFSAGEMILRPFQLALNEGSSNYLIQTPQFSPVIGAARYARSRALTLTTTNN